MAQRNRKIRLYLDGDLAAGAGVALSAQQAHYLGHVLRMAPGDSVYLFNGRDGEWRAAIEGIGRGSCAVLVTERVRAQQDDADLWLLFAPVKRAPIDFVAAKATELGVSVLWPVVTENTIVRRVNMARLRANAAEAAEQCGRLTVPEVREPVPIARVLHRWSAARRILLCDESGGGVPVADALAGARGADGAAPGPWAVLTGPEGGFTGSELDGIRKLPFVTAVGLGPRLLRADTAALSALACWQAVVGDRQIVAYMEAGCRPPADWRIGTEHEKFVFNLETLRPAPHGGEWGIGALLEGLTRFGWEPVTEQGNTIALVKDGCNITLEPGGQLELSGAQLDTIHETCAEVHTHLEQVKAVAGEIGVGLLGVGFQPKWRREDIPWMPKGRYRIMRAYMPTKGALGLDMMLRTCTVQVNLDFQSEADMVKKFRVGVALQPVAVALFADSPFAEGAPNGFLSYRSHVWEDTDPDRCGVLPFVFAGDMGFEKYVDYVLDVPMYFVYRGNAYIDASGHSFRDFLAGRLPALPGEVPTISDWVDHLTTLFPEVRLKRFLEMRGADGGPWRRLCALPSLWTGLLYDGASLDAAWDLGKDWTAEDHAALRAAVPKRALAAEVRGRAVVDVAREMLDLSRAGLVRRRRLDSAGAGETGYLDALDEIAQSGRSPAEVKLEAFHGAWAGDIDHVFREYAY